MIIPESRLAVWRSRRMSKQFPVGYFSQDGLEPGLLRCLEERGKEFPYMVASRDDQTMYRCMNVEHIKGDFPVLVVPTIVDTEAFYQVDSNPDLVCSLAYVGPPNLLIKRLLYPVGKYNVKIFGSNNWHGIAQYMGGITLEEQRQLYNSAVVSYANTPEEAARISACGGCAISLDDEVLAALGETFCVADIDELTGVMQLMKQWPQKRQKLINKQQEVVLPALTFQATLDKLKKWSFPL